jgi:hypothetical protein
MFEVRAFDTRVTTNEVPIPDSCPREVRARIAAAREARANNNVKTNHVVGVVSEDEKRLMRVRLAQAEL